jgi:hypothetical protein
MEAAAIAGIAQAAGNVTGSIIGGIVGGIDSSRRAKTALTIAREGNENSRTLQQNQLLSAETLQQRDLAFKGQELDVRKLQIEQEGFLQRGNQNIMRERNLMERQTRDYQTSSQFNIANMNLMFQRDLMQQSVASLRAAGLPEYLAYVSYSPEMQYRKRTSGVNFQTRWKGVQPFY